MLEGSSIQSIRVLKRVAQEFGSGDFWSTMSLDAVVIARALFSTIGSQDGCDRVWACVELNLLNVTAMVLDMAYYVV
jgi:hypothetical protein